MKNVQTAFTKINVQLSYEPEFRKIKYFSWFGTSFLSKCRRSTAVTVVLKQKNEQKNDDKKCRWELVEFSSYFLNQNLNPSRSKSDLILFSSYIDFSISHFNFHLGFRIFGRFWIFCCYLDAVTSIGLKKISKIWFPKQSCTLNPMLLSEKYYCFSI